MANGKNKILQKIFKKYMIYIYNFIEGKFIL